MVEQAKSRVAAVKDNLSASSEAGAPKPPVKKKDEGPKPTDASGHPLVKKLKTKFMFNILKIIFKYGRMTFSIKFLKITLNI